MKLQLPAFFATIAAEDPVIGKARAAKAARNKPIRANAKRAAGAGPSEKANIPPEVKQ